MKKNLLLLFTCLLAITAWADGPFRNHRYDSFRVLEPKEGSIVFIGNSITDMHCWYEAFKTSNGDYLPIVNRGNSGTYSTEQSDNLESYLGKNPKKVFMMIGTNDLASSGGLDFTGEQILAYVSSIVKRIHMRYPDTKIYLYSILNNKTNNRSEERWLHTNELVKKYVKDTNAAWLNYIDLYDKLTEVANGGVWSYDNLHLTAAAYQVWCETICEHLQEGESYTVNCVYPENTSTKQNSGTMTGAHGMRATYFSMLPISSNDVLVFGDELVKNGEWQELLGNPNVKNRGTGWGYGGDIATTSKIVDATFASTGITKENAKAIFLYTGTADANGTTNIATVKTNYTNLVNKIASYSPDSKIYLMALCPTNNASNTTNRIAVLNEHIKSLADSNIEYVDTYTPLLSGTTANSKYFYPDNYLGAMGYVKIAQIMQAALAQDFPGDTYTAISDETAQERYAQTGYRNLISQAIGQGMCAVYGTSVGEYSADAMTTFNNEVVTANALLASDKITAEQAEQQVERLKSALEAAMVKPKASTSTDEYWYQFTSQRSSNLYITATGSATGVVGSEEHSKKASSMWKLVERGDGSYDIVNREYQCYLSPSATYNTQIQTTSSKPSAGWEIKNSGTTGYFIIASGDVQLNQTGSAQSYAIYNWSDPNNKGNDLTDQGCQLKITEAPEPEEEPQGEPTIEYTVDRLNGNLYRGTTANQSWNNVWKSNATPQLQFGCGTINNMNWAGDNVQLMTGTAGSATYSITPPSGYAITEYSFTFTNNNHSTGLSLSMDNGQEYTTSNTSQTISAKNVKLFSLSFVLAGNNGNGVVLTDFKVKVKEDRLEKPQMSTAGNEHWYYITNASSKSYCNGKAIYDDAESELLRFGDKAFAANYIWSFWEENGKIAIKNYNGKYFGKAGAGTGGNTKFGTVDTPNYIYTIEDAFGFFIIKDDAVELHAQESGAVIVRWAADADGASLWRFDEVDVSSPEAVVASTKVEQGKVTTGIGNNDQPIIRSTIRVSGLTGNCNIQGVKGKFNGTDSKDIENVKAYFATNSRELFIDKDNKMQWRQQNGEQYGETVDLASDGTFTINGNKELAPGEHYLWITYDISDTAKEGNTVDASITSYTIDGNEVEEKNGNPNHQVTIFLSESAVLMPMDKGSLYYRIPAITVTRDGKRLVTLTDDRKGHNGDLPSHCYVVAQYSEDNGSTWSDPITVAGTSTTGGDYGHGDASIVTNRNNGDIIGIMTSAGTYGHGFFAGTAAQPPRWKTITSHDGGLTWEAPVDHTDDLYGANCSNPKTNTWKSGFSGSGAALQKRDGTLVSSFVNREADNSQNFYFFMSKDGGESWYVSGTSGTKSADEPKSLERNNGDLAISVRASGYNYYNYTSNDGETWHLPSQTRFTTGISGNACDGEYMVWCSTLEGNKWNIALQTLPNSGSRQNVSIALSTDEGATFGTPKTICPRGSAYSAVTVLQDGTLGVYYEEDGLFGGYTMRFVRFSLDWASNGKYKFTEENPFYPIKSTNTNGIELIEQENCADGNIYDLQGRKVSNPATGGIYIKNGKKYLVR